MTLALVDEALASGARLKPICEVLGISTRSIDRWRALGAHGGEDRRRGPRTTPENALTKAEQDAILHLVNSVEYRDLSPKQIVPRLADQGLYMGSESTLYRVLAKAGQNNHRQPSKPATRNKPKQTVADGPGQVLCWDITYLPAEVRGKFYYPYVFSSTSGAAKSWAGACTRSSAASSPRTSSRPPANDSARAPSARACTPTTADP
jgi:putative transposase